MTRNKLSDLNDHLFMTLERLGDEEMTYDELSKEIERSKAIANVASKVVENGRLILDAQKLSAEYGQNKTVNLELLNG